MVTLRHFSLLTLTLTFALAPPILMARADFKENQFYGTMLGALLGDSLGLPYEFKPSQPENVEAYFENLLTSPVILPKRISDDSSMAISVALSLLECRGLTISNMARRFVKQFFLDTQYYGGTVRQVFEKLRDTDFSDVFGPAKEVQNGDGSYGNGGAMRAGPFPLFVYGVQNTSLLVNMVAHASRITHAHPLGIAGAVFQALSVHHALEFGRKTSGISNGQVTALEILDAVKRDWDAIQSGSFWVESYDYFKGGLYDYSKKLDNIKTLLLKGNSNVARQEIVDTLGNGVAALDSAPTALYVFLASMQEIPGVKTTNPFERSIRFAISLAGDTDTIATMAGGMSGGYFGSEKVPESLVRHCTEGSLVKSISGRLYQFNERFGELPEILSKSALSSNMN